MAYKKSAEAQLKDLQQSVQRILRLLEEHGDEFLLAEAKRRLNRHDEVLDITIEELHADGLISTRAYNIFHARGIERLGQLIQCRPDLLLKLKNFGRGSLAAVERILKDRFGLHLNTTLDRATRARYRVDRDLM